MAEFNVSPPNPAAVSAEAAPTTVSGGVQLANKLSKVSYKKLNFVIMDRPTEFNLPSYLRELQKAGVTAVVRVCEPTYPTELLTKAGISVHEIPFEDGQSPPKEVISKWRGVVKETCGPAGAGCVAIHCVAGLGRAPVMVALALIDKGLDAVAAVELIRRERKGAINRRQLDFLRSYKPPAPKVCAIQ